MTTTIPVRAAVVSTLAAICFVGVACGAEQGTTPHPGSPAPSSSRYVDRDDTVAQIEQRKVALSQRLGRPDHALDDDVAFRVEQRKSTLGVR
jgi:hypothetical protein